MWLIIVLQKTGGGASANGDGKVSKNGDGSVTYQDPLDVYCEDNPETDECRYEAAILLLCMTCTKVFVLVLAQSIYIESSAQMAFAILSLL